MRALSLLIIASSFIAFSCTSTNTSSPESNVTVESEISGRLVSSFSKSSDQTQSPTSVSSLTVGRVRVLVSKLVLHSDGKEDSVDNKNIKLDPFVYVADSTGTKVIASVSMPNGAYDKMKWEIHRLSSSEIPRYSDDVVFRDFVTSGRYSVIVEGTLVRDGVTEPFVYRSTVTSNVTIKFATAVTVGNNEALTLSLLFDAASAFKDGARILDPSDMTNESKINDGIKAAFKANKKKR
ncbi:MAG: hypothetical protein NTX15_11790 [Candidatus Kapabacteria bacterium]|nr:hypothetical protein [Candidatus Kapabacteria bacterium]